MVLVFIVGLITDVMLVGVFLLLYFYSNLELDYIRTIVFAILEKTKVFGVEEFEGKKKLPAAADNASLEEVQKNMSLTKYPTEKIHFVKGKVEDTIPDKAPEKIAILRLDTDWYESTKHELEYLFPRLIEGGILIIDDYGHFEGSRIAVDEYLEKNNIHDFLHRIDYTGRLLVKK